MNFKSAKSVFLLGAINGVLFYLAYQPVKTVYVKYLWYIKNDNYVYIALPEIYRIARDAGELFVWTLLFALASYTAHRLWTTRVKSTIMLWIRVAIIALGVPIVGLWFLHFLLFFFALGLKQLDGCVLPMCEAPLFELLKFCIREGIDIKFEFLLFAVALTLNFIYGAVLEKMSNRLAK